MRLIRGGIVLAVLGGLVLLEQADRLPRDGQISLGSHGVDDPTGRHPAPRSNGIDPELYVFAIVHIVDASSAPSVGTHRAGWLRVCHRRSRSRYERGVLGSKDRQQSRLVGSLARTSAPVRSRAILRAGSVAPATRCRTILMTETQRDPGATNLTVRFVGEIYQPTSDLTFGRDARQHGGTDQIPSSARRQQGRGGLTA